MNTLPKSKLTLEYVDSIWTPSNYHCVYKESHKYTFFGYVRRSRELIFKSIYEEEARKVFKALGGYYYH